MGENIKVFQSKESMIHSLAEAIVDLARRKAEATGRFTVALSGGSTPKPLYESFASSQYLHKIPWDKVFFFFGDERCVPHDSEDSNYHMVHEAILSKVPVPAENIFPTEMQDVNPEASAELYEKTIKKFFALGENQLPRFDLMLLGLGPDGHTASLFPGTKALEERQRLVVSNYVEKMSTHRITLTLPVINNSENIIFVVAGHDKAPVIAHILGEKTADQHLYPAQLVKATDGSLKWYLDREAYQECQSHACQH